MQIFQLSKSAYIWKYKRMYKLAFTHAFLAAASQRYWHHK